MLVFVLFIVSLIITFLSYKTAKNRLFSPLFLSAGVTMVFSAIYMVFYGSVNSDISIMTLTSVVLLLMVTGYGEWIANRVKICSNDVNKFECVPQDLEVTVSKSTTIIVFLLELYTAISRYIKLFEFTKFVGNHDLMKTLKYARPYLTGIAKAKNVIDITNPVAAVISYFANPISYFYTFWFVYFYAVKKQKKWYYLLPVLGNAFILVTTTSRTVFLIIGATFITAYAYWNTFKNEDRGINFKMVGMGILFIIGFFIYGNVTRGGNSLQGIKVVFTYSSSGLYGLTEYFNNPWRPNEVFGQRTLKPLLDMMGNEISRRTQNTVLPFYIWGYHNTNDYSNLYTSLVLPIQDYGLLGMLFVRLAVSMVAVFMVKLLLRQNVNTPAFYLLLYYVNQFVYGFLSLLVADRFYAVFTDIKTMLINIVITYIAVRYIIQWKIEPVAGLHDSEGVLMDDCV